MKAYVVTKIDNRNGELEIQEVTAKQDSNTLNGLVEVYGWHNTNEVLKASSKGKDTYLDVLNKEDGMTKVTYWIKEVEVG